MWEVSTPFVYMRWFLYTFGQSESKFYIINGLLMVSTFFIFRNIMGVGKKSCCESCTHFMLDASVEYSVNQVVCIVFSIL